VQVGGCRGATGHADGRGTGRACLAGAAFDASLLPALRHALDPSSNALTFAGKQASQVPGQCHHNQPRPRRQGRRRPRRDRRLACARPSPRPLEAQQQVSARLRRRPFGRQLLVRPSRRPLYGSARNVRQLELALPRAARPQAGQASRRRRRGRRGRRLGRVEGLLRLPPPPHRRLPRGLGRRRARRRPQRRPRPPRSGRWYVSWLRDGRPVSAATGPRPPPLCSPTATDARCSALLWSSCFISAILLCPPARSFLCLLSGSHQASQFGLFDRIPILYRRRWKRDRRRAQGALPQCSQLEHAQDRRARWAIALPSWRRWTDGRSWRQAAADVIGRSRADQSM
jgi:hypothetical protein